MPAGVGRLEVLALLLTAAGLLLCGRGAWRLVAATRARLTYGAPYRRGQIADRLTGLLMAAPVLAAGVALMLLSFAQAAFQPVGSTVRVGRLEARRSEWGRVAVRFVPDPLYPADGAREGEVSGARWALGGDFVTWSGSVRWLGLRDGHRVRYLIGTSDSTGTTPAGRSETTEIDRLPAAARRLVRLAPYLPFVTVRTEASSWFPPTGRRTMILYATGAGYVGESAAPR